MANSSMYDISVLDPSMPLKSDPTPPLQGQGTPSLQGWLTELDLSPPKKRERETSFSHSLNFNPLTPGAAFHSTILDFSFL